MNMVQKSLLHWLDKQEEHERLAAYNEYENYYNGEYDLLKLLPKKIQDALKQELSIAGNFCKSIVDAKTQFLCGKPCSIIVTGPPDGDPNDERIKQAERDLYHIYNLETNGMLQENMGKLISITGKKGDGFIKLYQDIEIPSDSAWGVLDQIQIRALNPSHVFPKYQDDDYQKIEYVVIKTQTFDNDGLPIMKAQVFYPDHVDFYDLENVENTEKTDWVLTDSQPNPDGFIPIQHVKNNVSDLEFGISDLHVVTGFQDAINKTLTDLMCAMDYTAFQRLVISGALSKPGEKIDISPGNVIELMDAESKVSVIDPGDISGFLTTLENLIDMLFMVAQIPKAALGKIEGGVASGYALRVQYIPLENKCALFREIVRNQFRSLNNKIFKMIYRLTNGDKNYTDLEATIEFHDGLPVDTLSKAQEVIMLKDSGLMSRETALQETGTEDVEEEIKRIDADSFQEESFGAGRVATEASMVAKALQGAAITAEAQPENVPKSQQA